jgi:membrane-associated protein
MEFVRTLLDFFLHIDETLATVIATYGTWTYGILFTIIFCETGLVITPFLPGDSLLFAAGAFAAQGSLNVVYLFLLLWAAAVIGDSTNYWIGRKLGESIFTEHSRILKKRYLDRTHAFYEKHGPFTIIIARFVPIIRTISPFVAGVGAMRYRKFLPYDILGGLLWIGLFTFGGYFFGNIAWVKKNFEIVIVAIVFISLLPPFIEAYRHRRNARKDKETPPLV